MATTPLYLALAKALGAPLAASLGSAACVPNAGVLTDLLARGAGFARLPDPDPVHCSPSWKVFGFGPTIRDQFGGQIAAKSIKAVNLATPAATIEYAVKALPKVDGDASLVLVYSGHNEFMHFKDKDAEIKLISEPLFSAADRSRTLTHYESSLEEIVSHMTGNGTPIILFTAASNVADWAPTASILSSTENASAVRGLLDEAEALYASGQYEDALGVFLEVTDLEPGFAWGNFRAAASTETSATWTRPSATTGAPRTWMHRRVAPYPIRTTSSETWLADTTWTSSIR